MYHDFFVFMSENAPLQFVFRTTGQGFQRKTIFENIVHVAFRHNIEDPFTVIKFIANDLHVRYGVDVVNDTEEVYWICGEYQREELSDIFERFIASGSSGCPAPSIPPSNTDVGEPCEPNCW